MKPTFRETVDKQLGGMRFTDEMKLHVLAGCRRRRFSPHRLIFAAACAALLIIGAGLMLRMGLQSAPDTVAAPGYPVGQRFSSPGYDLVIDSYEWVGYELTIGCTVFSRADSPALIIRSPFECEGRLIEDGDAFLRPYAENALIISPGGQVRFEVTLRMHGCAPGQTFPIRLRADFMQPAAEILSPGNVPATTDTPMLVSDGSGSVDLISGAYADRYGDTVFIDYPTPVWAVTMERNYAQLPRMLIDDGIAGGAYETIEASLTATVPSTSRTGTLITNAAEAGNGLFYVTAESAAFTPDGSALHAVIVPGRALMRKAEYTFAIRFTGAGGALEEEYSIAPYIVNTAYDGSITIYFDSLLDFAPESIVFTCEWTDGGASGAAEAAFDHDSF